MANGYQSNQDFLQSLFGPLGVGADAYSDYAQFIPEVPEELYLLTDPTANIYQQLRGERQARLSTQLGESYSGIQQSLFETQRQARGMQGRAGFVTGADLAGDASRRAAMVGEKASSAFSRGLYDIEQDIVEQVGAEQRYVAGLEAQRRSDALKVAELADLFDESARNRDNRYRNMYDNLLMNYQDNYGDRSRDEFGG